VFFAALGESSSVRRHFLINLLIGLGLFALLRTPFVQQNRVVAAARDAVITWQMDRLTGLDQAPQLAWINIDDAAETRWGFQGTTPRDKLADLIAFAVRGQPKVVFVDIDLTDPVPGLERENAVLARYLQGLPHECSGTCPPVVLARMTGPSNYYYAGRGRALQTLPSFVDAPLGTSPARPWAPGNLRWGTINTDRDPDMVERHWRLWENSCTAPGSAVVTPSAMLLTAAIAGGTKLEDVEGDLQRNALTCVPKDKRASPPLPEPGPTHLQIGKGAIYLAEDDISRRIVYRIPWSRENPSATRLDVILPADEITSNAHADPSILYRKVVVIGTSCEKCDDRHNTPIGEMPGSLVMINAINSLLSGEDLQQPSWYVALLIEVALVAIVSALFVYLPRWWALVASLATIVFGTLTVGFVAFNSGIWVDSVVPMLAVVAHEFAEHIHHHVSRLLRAK
jgi:hypothetical protein